MPVRAPKGPAQARRVWPRDPRDTWVPAWAIGADKPCGYLPAAPLDRFGRCSFGRCSLSHEAAPTATVSSSATVSESALANVTAAANITTAVEGNALSGVLLATFTDPGNSDGSLSLEQSGNDYQADINWGDGTGVHPRAVLRCLADAQEDGSADASSRACAS